MCQLCIKIDQKIDHFKEMASRGLSPETVCSIDILIAELEGQKAALHPERKSAVDTG
jgi:hypothetical protein